MSEKIHLIATGPMAALPKSTNNPFEVAGIATALDSITMTCLLKGLVPNKVSMGSKHAAPFIRFQITGKPRYRYIREESVLNEVAEKYKITPQEVRSYENEEASYYFDFLLYSKPCPPTEEYKAWEAANLDHAKRVLSFFLRWKCDNVGANPLAALTLKQLGGHSLELKPFFATINGAISKLDHAEISPTFAEAVVNEFRSFASFLESV